MVDADDGAPDVDAARLDRGRAEKRADKRRQQIFEADAGLADAQARGEQNAGESGQQPRRDEGVRSYSGRTGMPFSAAAFGLAPMA